MVNKNKQIAAAFGTGGLFKRKGRVKTRPG
jgi:hypothetical protein